MAKYPLVSISILNWNGIDDTLRCLDSVKKLDYPNFEIIVVDNGSQDDSVAKLRKVKGITLIESSYNTGFAGGHVLALSKATGEYIALLNNDMVVAPDWLKQVVACAHSNDADIVGGRSYSWNESNKPFDSKNEFASYQTINPITAHTAMLHSGNRTTEANNLSGSNLLVSKTIIDKIGYLDTDFFAYYEETDFISRAKRAGHKAVYCPTAHVWHKSGASTANKRYFYFYQMHRNRFWFAIKNFDGPELRKFIVYYGKEAFGAFRRNLRVPSDHDKAMYKAALYNLMLLPKLLIKRHESRKFGGNYLSLITAPSEGFDDVTVVVPCYNYANYVVEALNSLENQILKPVEVIIINDGSTDNSVEVINKYLDEVSEKSTITYTFIDKANEGVIATKNLAKGLVKTNWMMFLDADDTLDKKYIYECVLAARKGDAEVVYTDMEMFGAISKIHKVTHYNKHLLRAGNFINNSALFKTSLFLQSGGYKQEMSIGFEDWELYLTFSELTNKFSYIPKPLLNYRRHDAASRDTSSQLKLPTVVRKLEELHPKLYGVYYFWWLEFFRAREHFVELLKLPFRLLRHTKSHVVKHAIDRPDTTAAKLINSIRTRVKER